VHVGHYASVALVVALTIVPIADAARRTSVPSGSRGFSRAKVIPRHGFDEIRFTAARGEHVAPTVETRVCHIPFPGLDGSCVIFTNAGSRIGYQYFVTHNLGNTVFDYGCLIPSSSRLAHEAVCPDVSSDHLMIDLARALRLGHARGRQVARGRDRRLARS
jgi:hypothetical protein